jgi:hypothetical protein
VVEASPVPVQHHGVGDRGRGRCTAPAPAAATSHGEQTVSVLNRGDEDMHYVDSSHRWVCPYRDGDETAWMQRVRAHMEDHKHERSSPRVGRASRPAASAPR